MLSLCLVTKFYPSICDPMDCSLPGSSVHGISQGRNIGVGCHFLLQGIFLTGIKPMAPALQADSLPLSHWEAQIFTEYCS